MKLHINNLQILFPVGCHVMRSASHLKRVSTNPSPTLSIFWTHKLLTSRNTHSGVARVSPEGVEVWGKEVLKRGSKAIKFPSKSIKYAKSPTSREGGAMQGARMSREGGAVAYLPPLATPLNTHEDT